MVFFNKLFSLPLSFFEDVFEYCVQVFPCVHTLEDGAQVVGISQADREGLDKALE